MNTLEIHTQEYSMEFENDPLYPFISEAHTILPNVSCFEFIDEKEDVIRYKLEKFGLSNPKSQDKYLHFLEMIRNST